jgi:hypothetical protein
VNPVFDQIGAGVLETTSRLARRRAVNLAALSRREGAAMR